MFKPLLALPFVALVLLAAAPAAAQVQPKPSINPPAEIAADPANRLNLELSSGGTVVIQLRPDLAPAHVQRIQTLVSRGFYNGLPFHRVIPGFMAQGGDPTGTGNGGSPLPDLAAEFNDLPHLRGVMSMARTEEPNSANSQFFLMLAPTFSLNHKYTGLGRVISGMQFVDAIAPGEPPAQPTKIVRAWLDGPMPAAVAAVPAAPPAATQPQPQPQAEAVPPSGPPVAAPGPAQPQPQAETEAAAPEPEAEDPAAPAEEPTAEPKDPATGG